MQRRNKRNLNEAWGKGKRFGFVAISKNEYYWFAVANYKNNYQEEFQNVDLVDFYSDFNHVISKMIRSTPKENLLTNEILDLKPISNWYKNNICLLGDSAHATTPNLGQGACQAIESSMVLANCLAKHKSAEKAFKEFQAIRIKKATDIVNTSWQLGKMAHLENSLLIKLRNFVLRKTPEKIAYKQTRRLFEIDN